MYGTDYKPGAFVILPESTNISPKFGKIFKILCCEKFGYIYYQKTKSTYSPATDLFMITDTEDYAIVPCQQLPSYHTIEGYLVGEKNEMSLSLISYISEHL